MKQERYVTGKISVRNIPKYFTVLLVLFLTISLSSGAPISPGGSLSSGGLLSSGGSLHNTPYHPSFRKSNLKYRTWRCPGYNKDISEIEINYIKERVREYYVTNGPSKMLVTGTPYSSQIPKGERLLQWHYDSDESTDSPPPLIEWENKLTIINEKEKTK
ncbi:hypothetical protein GcM1_128006 [Golovinomyces cichoracearum]|uniref:Uncharacterized protein n=1 Tax=Golovinomyces cichoracearum TaxID=62708 RepID=A0A420JBT0_9PEZI|nr:hypothetical protein GcM1_128006 [Golovinomyces cichoracearum]